MELPRDAVLLRIFVEEGNEHDGEPLFRKIVLKARELGLAGATVLRGPLGFGRASELHASGLFHPLTGASIVIEIVDAPDRIEAFIPDLQQMVGDGLITLERAEVLLYRPSS